MAKKFSLKLDAGASEKNEYVNIVEKSLTTPIVPLKYCYLCKPFFYPGSHVPRYSVSLLFDKNIKDQKTFLTKLEALATKNKVETLGYLTDSGLILIKFQTKDPIKTYAIEFGKKVAKEIDLQHDLPEGFKVSVNFELNTYLNKKTGKNGFNFCPSKVTFHLDAESQAAVEVESDGDSKDSRDRPKPKSNGVRSDKLQHGNKRSVGDKLRTGKNSSKV